VRQGENLGPPSELLVDVDPASEHIKVTGQAVPIRQPRPQRSDTPGSLTGA
jgi:hypothetical protein